MSATLQEACYENTTAVYMALELSNKQWKVLIGDGHHRRHKTVVAGDIAGLLEQIAIYLPLSVSATRYSLINLLS